MSKYTNYITLFLLLTLASRASAQLSDPERAAVRMIANPGDNKITLRWAPTSHTVWEFANKFGYTVQRVTILRNNVPLKDKDKILLAQNIIPKPLAAWETEVKQNKYAAVAAQALYGAHFQVSQQSTGMMEVVNQVRENEQRFAFALFAADYSPIVAEMSGLSFTDSKANYEENYLYKVWVNMPDKRNPIDTGYVYTGLKEHRELPSIQKPDVKFADRQALISWNYGYYTSNYIAYVVERSSDGKNFVSISKEPIVPTEDISTPSGIIHVIDTLTDNTVNYTYRVKGISAFGETGPVSEIVSGHGKIGLSAAPAIRHVNIINNKQVLLQWEYPVTVRSEIQGFQVERSLTPKGKFEAISPVLKPEVKEFTDNAPGGSNYYRVVAMGIDDKTFSFPHLVQLKDSIPPSVPVGIKTSVDTAGIITLQWERGKEGDLLGYRVYRSNFDSHEFTQVTVSPLEDPFFRDTINLKTLTKNIYYKVVAVDRHFNPSGFSDALVVTRPDVLPPVAPAFRNIQYRTRDGIILQWTPSSSQDVKHYLLYRRTTFDNAWRLITVIVKADTSAQFIDKQVQNKNAYEYILLAVDEAGLESKPSSSIRITVYDRNNKVAIDKFFAKSDKDNKQILLSWLYDVADVQQFLIYRSGSDGHMRLFETVPGNRQQFSDTQLTVNTQYQYSIKAVFTDGAQSPFSKLLKVLY